MSALHDLLAYVLGFDPEQERARHRDLTNHACEQNRKAHKEFRKRLEEDPLTELLRHIRPSDRNGHDDGRH